MKLTVPSTTGTENDAERDTGYTVTVLAKAGRWLDLPARKRTSAAGLGEQGHPRVRRGRRRSFVFLAMVAFGSGW